MSTASVIRAVNGFLEYLVHREIALDYVPTVNSARGAGGTRITWAASEGWVFQLGCDTLRDYVACVEKRQYSALLHDGSLIQLTYDLDASNEICGHRLVFWPGPFRNLDLRQHPTASVADVICEYYLEALADPEKIHLKGPWRFDYDPSAASDRHPETHLTVMHTECRLPGSRPLDLRRFCVLVFNHLHIEQYDDCEDWSEAVPRPPSTASLRSVNPQYLHVHWRDTY